MGTPRAFITPPQLTNKAHLDASILVGPTRVPCWTAPKCHPDGHALSINVSALSTSKARPDAPTTGHSAASMTQKHPMKEPPRSTAHQLSTALLITTALTNTKAAESPSRNPHMQPHHCPSEGAEAVRIVDRERCRNNLWPQRL